MLTEFSWVSLAHAQRSVTERERPSQSSAGPSQEHQLRRQPSPVDPAEAAGAEPRPLGQPVGVSRGARQPGRLKVWSRTVVPPNRQFACRRDVTSRAPCLSLATCPLRKKVADERKCRTRCVQVIKYVSESVSQVCSANRPSPWVCRGDIIIGAMSSLPYTVPECGVSGL